MSLKKITKNIIGKTLLKFQKTLVNVNLNSDCSVGFKGFMEAFFSIFHKRFNMLIFSTELQILNSIFSDFTLNRDSDYQEKLI